MPLRAGAIAGLPDVLRRVRLRAGLTQTQVASALGVGARSGRKLIWRLEHGRIRSPSLCFILDFLRACKASLADIAPLLDEYLARPLPVPAPAQRGPQARQPDIEDPAALELRREAAKWILLQVNEHMLHHELHAVGMKPLSRERRCVALYGRKVFRILLRDRRKPDKVRAKHLARARAWAVERAGDLPAIDHVFSKVSELFADMEKQGELEWLPLREQAQAVMVRPPAKRILSDFRMCRSELAGRQLRELATLAALAGPIVQAAERMLRAGGISEVDLGSYRGFVNIFVKIGRETQTGSAERQRRLETALSHRRAHHDPALLRRLAELVFSLSDAKPEAESAG